MPRVLAVIVIIIVIQIRPSLWFRKGITLATFEKKFILLLLIVVLTDVVVVVVDVVVVIVIIIIVVISIIQIRRSLWFQKGMTLDTFGKIIFYLPPPCCPH